MKYEYRAKVEHPADPTKGLPATTEKIPCSSQSEARRVRDAVRKRGFLPRETSIDLQRRPIPEWEDVH
jgi:hypothetical protein